MSLIVQNEDGCIIDHLQASVITLKTSDIDKTGDSAQQYRLKADLFEIVEPYRMDSQFEKLQSTALKDDGQKRKRKRKRKEPLNIGEKMAADFHNEVKDYIEKAYESLLKTGKEMAYFMDQNSDNFKSNNTCARKAALGGGSLCSFIDMCEQSQQEWNQRCHVCHTPIGQCAGSSQCCTEHDEQSYRNLNQSLPVYQVTKVKDLLSSGIVNVIWQNTEQFAVSVQCRGDNYIIPPNSKFLISDIEQLYKTGKALGKFDLIVMDPPWTNKSVKRKKKYYTMDNDMLLDLPLLDLMNPGCVVVVWVTNKQKHIHFVTEQLFPSRNIRFIARWYWLKVTKTGQCVFDLDSLHKKPYETLIIGKYQSATIETVYSTESDCINHQKNIQENKNDFNDKPDSSLETYDPCQTGVGDSDEGKKSGDGKTETDKRSRTDDYHGDPSHIPDNKVIISVPCSLHSKKPPLTEVIQPYLPDKPRCLEMFARNLLPHWTSWGNEILLHQHKNFYEEVT